MAEEKNNVEDFPVTKVLEDNYMPYAVSVIVSRAIPEIDGLKPSHRKLLYTMYEMGLSKGPRSKCSNIVGQTMKLNPHGDQAIYETLVRMTTGNETLLYPYIDSKGNMGKHYSRDMAFAAHRYTEARLSPICKHLFSSIDKNTVEMVDNYDGRKKEPLLLPVEFPSILVNSNQGIAVGMASNICSFNLREIIDATKALIKDPQAPIKDLIKAPDFPTGASWISDEEAMESVLEKGVGSLMFQAKYRIDKKGRHIEIFEIPFSTTTENVVEDITDLIKTGKTKDINDIRDETDISGMKVTIDYKRDTDPEELMTYLLQNTRLRDSFSANFNVLVEGIPHLLGVRGILIHWLDFRRSCVKREVRYDLEKASQRLHLLRGLEKILLDIDKAVRIVRKTEREKEVIPNLCKAFNIDEVQAEFVAEIKLRNFNKEYIIKQTKSIKDLEDRVEDLEKILNSNKRIDQLIIERLNLIREEFGQDRKTDIIELKEEKLKDDYEIDDYNLKLYRTREGYIKKLALTSLRTSPDLKLKEEDQIVQVMPGKNKSTAIFLTNYCLAYKLFLYEIEDQKPSQLGEYAPNLLDLEDGEKVIYSFLTDDYRGSVLIAFEDGRVAKFPLSTYYTKQNRKKLTKAFSDKSKPIFIDFLEEGEERDYLMRSSEKKGILFSSEKIPLKQSRSIMGIYVLRKKKGVKATGVWRKDMLKRMDLERFRYENLPGSGKDMKNEPKEEQLSLF